jgi:putative sigma-54 modulation protein
MNIKIHSLHFDADQKLLEFVEGKVQKLSQFEDGILNTEVVLRLDKDHNSGNKVAEIKLKVARGDAFAKKQCRTFEEATDQAVEALRRQLVKQKQKKIGR